MRAGNLYNQNFEICLLLSLALSFIEKLRIRRIRIVVSCIKSQNKYGCNETFFMAVKY